jgi:hypothetical protein
MPTLLLPTEVDQLLRYPLGKSERLARRGKLEHIKLPDGSIRFERETIEKILHPTAERVVAA